MRTLFSLILILILIGDRSQAKTVVEVSSLAQLRLHLTQPSNGNEILLHGGDYGHLSISDFSASSDDPIVIRALNISDLPQFSGVSLHNVHNIVFKNILFDYVFEANDKPYFRPFNITSSSGITIKDSILDGDVAFGRDSDSNGFGTAFGLSVRSSSSITVQNNQIRGFLRGLSIDHSQNIAILNNNVYDIRTDGMTFAEVAKVSILENHIHDFNRPPDSKDHADMIQFWTNGTKSPSTDILIQDNILNSGGGRYTQSIFMRNELVDKGLAGFEMFYKGITISGNVVLNAHLHGISIGETDNLRIENNTVVRNFKSEGEEGNSNLWIPQIRVSEKSRNVKILRNVVGKIAGFNNQLDWTVDKNLLVQDQSRLEPNFYGKVFGINSLKDPSKIQSFSGARGGPLEEANIGASILSE